MKKVIKTIAILFAVVVVCIVAFVAFLWFTAEPIVPKDAVVVSNELTEQLSAREAILPFVGGKDFHDFDVVTYERTNDKGEKEVIVQCNFMPELSEAESDEMMHIGSDTNYKDHWVEHDGCKMLDYDFSKAKSAPKGLSSKSRVSGIYYYGDNMFYLTFVNPEEEK